MFDPQAAQPLMQWLETASDDEAFAKIERALHDVQCRQRQRAAALAPTRLRRAPPPSPIQPSESATIRVVAGFGFEGDRPVPLDAYPWVTPKPPGEPVYPPRSMVTRPRAKTSHPSGLGAATMMLREKVSGQVWLGPLAFVTLVAVVLLLAWGLAARLRAHAVPNALPAPALATGRSPGVVNEHIAHQAPNKALSSRTAAGASRRSP